jgi:3-deoxy-D-manno-octulosonic-acid transferase
MYFLYSLVLSLLFLGLLPYFVYQAARRGKYSGSFKERMGILPGSVRSDSRSTIWVHAVSVGEFLAARPLITRLKADLPTARVLVSTTTLTGQELARSHSHLFDGALYFPFDWKFSVRRALDWVKPSVVIILETELWPNFLRECRRREILTVLANGRISARSFRRYRLLGRPFSRAIADFSLMIMQSESDAEHARRLRAPPDRVLVCGNLKYDQPEEDGLNGEEADATKARPQTKNPSADVDHQFGLSATSHLIVAGSTAAGEEEVLLESLRTVRSQPGLEAARLLLAPRHPERFDEVARLIVRSGLTLGRRSEQACPSRPSATQFGPDANLSNVEMRVVSDEVNSARRPDVILLDTIGELASIYRFAAVVFVGGSLVKRGGHNIIEPAAFAKPIIVGPHTENFRKIVMDFLRAEALVQISGSGDLANNLARELIRLLSDRQQARAIGERARGILLENRGATACTVAAITSCLGSRITVEDAAER